LIKKETIINTRPNEPLIATKPTTTVLFES